MPTLRQKVDAFCKDAGAKVDASDKLRRQVLELKAELKTAKETHKNHMKQMKAASKTQKAPKVAKAPKMTAEEKGQAKREKAVTKELAKAAKANQVVAMKPLPKAPKIKQEVAMNPLPPSPVVATAGRRMTRRNL
jgi:hypothetical protein